MGTEQIFALILIFVAVVAGVLGTAYAIFGGVGRLRNRLRGLSDETPISVNKEMGVWQKRALRAAAPIAKLATPESEEDISKLRMRFMHAGYRDSSAPSIYFAAKALLALALPGAMILVSKALSFEFSQQKFLFFLLFLAAIGYYLPSAIVSWQTRIRQRELFEAFPDSIDLMIVCVEAGLALDMAINRSAAEMRLRSPILADELDLVAMDLRVGSTRERALKNFANRTGLEEISTFVAMLIQADRFGTSLGESLRVHADGLRTRRRMRAEEAAAKIALKMLFPLIFCIFPSLMLVLLGPAFIQISRTLLPSMGGG
jgi:tight adherence protein C